MLSTFPIRLLSLGTQPAIAMSFYIPSFEEYLALYGPDAGQLFPSPKVLTCWVKHLWLGAGGDLPKNLSRELSVCIHPGSRKAFVSDFNRTWNPILSSVSSSVCALLVFSSTLKSVISRT